MDTEGGEQPSISAQFQSRGKKGHMMNIYLTHSDGDSIVDFVKDHKKLNNKINKPFKDRARKNCPREMFANRCNLHMHVQHHLL